MTAEIQRRWAWFQDRIRLVWPFAVALGLVGISVQRLVPLVQENGVLARNLGRLNRELELLQQHQNSATAEDIDGRVVQALASLVSGDEGVRRWVRAMEEEARGNGFACESRIESAARAWEGEPRVDVVEVVLSLNARGGFDTDPTSSARFTNLLDSLAARSEWVEFTELTLRSSGAGLISATITVRLWVLVPAS
ncbi:MAG TPA: hypothetical protein PLX89_25080 [Verrucomicrobiota bacterium]|nr:hypothetical protein [Verrucomicrobiales bacterium]HRI16281.1 hypothetical protein [Verrucomicrobiota bacterium]